MEVLARVGLVTRGVLYLLTAVIIVELVRTRGREEDEASNTGALAKIAEQPFGRTLLVVVAIGLAGYALWRFAEAWLRRDDKAIERVANLGRGVVYVLLLVTTIRILRSDTTASGSGSGDQQVDTILDWPAGQWIVGADMQGQKLAWEADLSGSKALVMGGEGDGLRELTRKSCDLLVRLPQAGSVESMNVSVACGMLLYEAVRQRGT